MHITQHKGVENIQHAQKRNNSVLKVLLQIDKQRLTVCDQCTPARQA